MSTQAYTSWTTAPMTTQLLPALQWSLIITLFLVGGITWCFILWIIPVIKLNASVSAFDQFAETTNRGHMYLKPLSRVLVGLFALTAFIVSRQPNPETAATWKNFAGAGFTMAQVAWWEILIIFPMNDEIAAMKDRKENFRDADKQWLGQKGTAELFRRMNVWVWVHAVRASLPLIAAFIAFYPMVQGKTTV